MELSTFDFVRDKRVCASFQFNKWNNLHVNGEPRDVCAAAALTSIKRGTQFDLAKMLDHPLLIECHRLNPF